MALMRRWPRRVVITCAAILGGALALSLATSLWLMAWVPTAGKAWLEAQLERQVPLEIRIGAMRYSLWDGLRLEDLRGTDPTTHTVWLHASHVHTGINLLTLALQRQVAFHLKAVVMAPCATDLAMSGRYRLHTHQLTADMLSSDIPVDGMLPQLAQRVPALKAGTVRIMLHVGWQRGGEPILTGRMTGTKLAWEEGPTRLTGNAVVEGTAIPTPHGQRPWAVDLVMRVDQGRLEGLPFLKQAEEVSGTLRLTNESLQITTLRGKTFGSPWQLEGVVGPLGAPRVDVLLRSHVDVAMVAAHLIGPMQPWQPDGKAQLLVVCRGPLARWPDIEVMAKAELREVSLLIPTFPHRLEHVTGHLEYDRLTKRLVVESLRGDVQENPLMLEGSVSLTTPAVVHLVAKTTAELGLFKEVLPQGSPIQSLAGRAVGHLELHGPVTRPTWRGEAVLEDARVLLRGLPKPIEGLRGVIRFTNEEISTPRLSFTMDDEPVLLTGTVTDLTTSPRLTSRAEFANGSVSLNGTVQADRFLVDRVELTLGNSSLRIQGDVSRLPDRASHLIATGTVALSDLSRIPWVHPTGLEAWQPDGTTMVHLRLLGPANDWRSIEAAGFLHADHLVVRGVPFRAVSAELEQGQGRVAVRLTHAALAGGRLTGEFLTQTTGRDEPARYLLECDLTGADLAQLAASIPAWHQRQLQGSASAHASFSGFWNDRGSLRGEGWVHATGEQLGELPVIDRLFRGVFGALAERLGLAGLRKAQLTKLAGQWRLSQERIITDDLRLTGTLGMEPIIVALRGSVGLDATLDLTVEPELPEQLVLQAPNTSTLSTTILKVVGGAERLRRLVGRHHLGGTIDHPQYTFEFSLDQLLNQLFPSGLGQILESVR